MWPLCCYWSTIVSEQDSAGTGLHIYALPFCSKPKLLDLSSPNKPVTRDGCDDKERDWQGESEKCPSQSAVSVSAPLEAIPTQSSQICGRLRGCTLVHPLLALLISLPTPWESANAHSLTIMTTTIKSMLETRSERKPDYVGRERKVNMVTVSGYTLPLILQRLFANMRDNAPSCSYWAMADA